MGAGQVFSVLTEFKFDVAEAVASSEALQKSTDKLAQSADNALDAFKSLGYGLAGALGLGGIGGMLEHALKQSDAFHSSVLDFTSLITSNMNALQGGVGSFNDRLAAGQAIMGKIADEADRLNLDQGQMFSMVQTLAPEMIQKGVAGNNFSNVISYGGQATGLAPSLGLSQSEMATQIQAAIGGTAASGALMNRLAATKAFKGTDMDAFNGLDIKERMKMLSEGLKEVSADMGDAAERSNLFSYQMKRLKTLFLGDENGMGSILKPLGDSIRPFFVGMLKDINGYVSVQGKQIASNFAQLMGSFVSTPKEMLASLMQFRELKNDVGKAGKTLAFSSAMMGFGQIISKITNIAFFANPVVGALAGGLSILSDVMSRTNDPLSRAISSFLKWSSVVTLVSGILTVFGVFWQTLGFILGEVLLPLALLTTIFQGISKGLALARIEDAETLLKLMPKITEILTRAKMAFHNIMVPVELAVDGIAEMTKYLFMWGGWFEMFLPQIEGATSKFEYVGEIVVAMMAVISGAFASMFEMLLNYKEKGVFHIFDNMGKSFDEGFDDFINKHKQAMANGKNVANSVVNNHFGNVEIKNDFKENQEPDRIAFTLKEQLLKAAQNPTQARGRAFQAGFASR